MKQNLILFLRKYIVRKLIVMLAGCLMFITCYADLGNIQVDSYLSQKLKARIPISGLPANVDYDNFRIELAGYDKFRENDLDYSPELGSLQFKVVPNGKYAYLNITSSKIINSPVLSFLLHYKLGNNDFYRQYTILLDPPPAEN